MRTVLSLIDDAIEMCGSVTHLAQRIGVNRAQVPEDRRGEA